MFKEIYVSYLYIFFSTFCFQKDWTLSSKQPMDIIHKHFYVISIAY